MASLAPYSGALGIFLVAHLLRRAIYLVNFFKSLFLCLMVVLLQVSIGDLQAQENPNTIAEHIQGEGILDRDLFSSPCESTTIQTEEGTIIVDGLVENTIPIIRVSTRDRIPFYQCWGNKCDLPTQRIHTGGGTFQVRIDYFTTDYTHICATGDTIFVNDPCIHLGGDEDKDGICDEEDDCIGEDCDLSVIYEGCGLSFTHNGLSLTTNNTENASVLIYDIQAKQTVHLCTPWNDTCEDHIAIELQPNKPYLVLIRTYQSKCSLSQIITTPSSLLNSSSRSSSYTQQNNSLVDLPSLLENEVIRQILLEDAKEVRLQVEKENPSISLFPNPVANNLFVNMSAFAGQQGQWSIMNNLGQEIAFQTLPSIATTPLLIDVSSLKSGLFYLQIMVNGEVKQIKKIIVE